MVVKDFWQPSTDSPTCWTWPCRRTMALRRRASTQKVLVSKDTLSRSATRLETRWSSIAGSKQIPRE
jgi:hypothetical protein